MEYCAVYWNHGIFWALITPASILHLLFVYTVVANLRVLHPLKSVPDALLFSCHFDIHCSSNCVDFSCERFMNRHYNNKSIYRTIDEHTPLNRIEATAKRYNKHNNEVVHTLKIEQNLFVQTTFIVFCLVVLLKSTSATWICFNVRQ